MQTTNARFFACFREAGTVQGFTSRGDSAKVAAREFPEHQTHVAETRWAGRGDVRALID
jgi:hypothetical protein